MTRRSSTEKLGIRKTPRSFVQGLSVKQSLRAPRCEDSACAVPLCKLLTPKQTDLAAEPGPNVPQLGDSGSLTLKKQDLAVFI